MSSLIVPGVQSHTQLLSEQAAALQFGEAGRTGDSLQVVPRKGWDFTPVCTYQRSQNAPLAEAGLELKSSYVVSVSISDSCGQAQIAGHRVFS